MLSGKQKRFLRARANSISSSILVGKQGLSSSLIKQMDEELENNELIKITVHKSAPLGTRETAHKAANDSGAEIVQVIGRKAVLFRQSIKEPVIILPE